MHMKSHPRFPKRAVPRNLHQPPELPGLRTLKHWEDTQHCTKEAICHALSRTFKKFSKTPKREAGGCLLTRSIRTNRKSKKCSRTAAAKGLRPGPEAFIKRSEAEDANSPSGSKCLQGSSAGYTDDAETMNK